ncbi:MAG: hypothetical protein J6A59_11565 [Lachnospiraceae bacterium]|nr:hypothetical protein [Lachnospiraceae bacterium]
MNRIKKDIVFWILFIVLYIMTAIFMVILPDKIPLDIFDLEGEWGSKYYFVKISVAFSIIELVFYFGYRWLTGKKLKKITDEREQAVIKNSESHNKIMMLALFFMITILYFVIFLIKYLAIQGHDINMADIVGVVTSIYMSIAWIMLGNYMPRMHENKESFGQRWKNITPQTQRKVNKISGIVLMLCGVLSLILTFVVHNIYAIIITFGLTFITAVMLLVITYIVYTKEENKTNDSI